MRFPGRRKGTRKESDGLDRARAARRQAEEYLARERDHVIIPLREIRESNHIQEDISRLIRRRVRREIEGS